jgi:hypothetical protein
MRKYACHQIVTEKYPEAITLHIIDTGDLNMTLSWVFRTNYTKARTSTGQDVRIYSTYHIRDDIQLEDQDP